MNLDIIVHKNEPQEPRVFTIEKKKEINTISIPVKYAENKESDQISIPVKYAEKDNDYEEILSMLESIKDNEKALRYIKNFFKGFIKRYC